MSRDPKLSIELHKLCGKLREGEITDAEAKRLDTLLLESKAARRFYRTFMALASALETRSSVQDTLDAGLDSGYDIDVLAELLGMEEAADAKLVSFEEIQARDREALAKAQANATPKIQSEPITLHSVLDTTGYALGLALKSKPAKKFYTYAGVAAVLALVVTLAIVFASDEAPIEAPLASDHSDKPAASTQSTPRGSNPVATLTAEHDAQWDSQPAEDLRRGSKLHPGTRLTLTAGVAEITTHDGAIAILEAPCTVELIDNNNAIRLHAGKLVGSCYSESSKGFVVKTEHADITDIGTEFGVEVSAGRVTATVITGEIEMNVPGSAPKRLTQDQTAQLRVNGVNRKLQIKDQLAQGFEALLPRRRLAEALRNDPAMIAYWGFEAEDIVDGKLLNRAVATQGKMNGTLGQTGKPDSSPTLAEGRLPGTGALRFEAEEFDLVRISQDDAKAIDGLEQFTIGVWVKPDHMDQMSHHLVTKRARDGLNFGLCWDGRLGSGYARNTVFFEGRMGQSKDAEADSLHRRSAWMHLVVTYDRGERSIYLDGALIERLPRQDAGRLATLDAELLIGAATPHLSETGAYLDGDLDELFILGRSMSADEITTLYETGVAQP